MGPVFYILAIMGCGEGESACAPIATTGTSYQSVDACNQASEGALMDHVDAAFPVLVAQCHRADHPAAAKLWADEVKRPGPATKERLDRTAYKPAPPRKG